MDIDIVNLVDHKQFIPQVAEWVHAEWSAISGREYEETVDRYSEGKRDSLPLILAALVGDEPAGIVNLREKEDFLTALTSLSPWITDVYVRPDYRGKGIGSKLLTGAIQEADKLGFTQVYLATEDQQQLYQRHGFNIIDQAEIGNGIKVDIMKIKFPGHPNKS